LVVHEFSENTASFAFVFTVGNKVVVIHYTCQLTMYVPVRNISRTERVQPHKFYSPCFEDLSLFAKLPRSTFLIDWSASKGDDTYLERLTCYSVSAQTLESPASGRSRLATSFWRFCAGQCLEI